MPTRTTGETWTGAMAPPKKQCSPEERARLDRLAEKRREYVRRNKELVKAQQDKARKTFYKKSKDKVLQWNREYRAQNYKSYLARTCRERKKKRATDPLYVIKDRLRARLKSALKRKGVVKTDTTMRLVGCTPDELIAHLGAVPKGSQIEHIFPFELYNLKDPKDVRKVMHISNMRIATAEENSSKGTKLPTKAMADQTEQFKVWPRGIKWDDLPDRYDGWINGLRMR